MALSNDALLEAATGTLKVVAESFFPDLPVRLALDLLGKIFNKPVEEITVEELDAYLAARLLRQRANLT